MLVREGTCQRTATPQRKYAVLPGGGAFEVREGMAMILATICFWCSICFAANSCCFGTSSRAWSPSVGGLEGGLGPE